jgi:hypothetical protein
MYDMLPALSDGSGKIARLAGGAVMALLLVCGRADAQETVIFEDHFEAGLGAWELWQDSSWVQRPDCPYDTNCWGPSDGYVRMDDGSHYYLDPLNPDAGSVRHDMAQPWWCGRWHEETGLADPSNLDRTITASIWQFEDFNHQAPFPPGNWAHDQVQSWLVLMSEDEAEYFAIGVHAYNGNPASWWTNLSWATASDGWQVTTYPRSQGWRSLKIVLHPYTGRVGDVEFYVAPDPDSGVGSPDNPPQYVLVGCGRRQATIGTCQGVPVTRVGIGANPRYIPEDYIANTYEVMWYDDALVTAQDAPLPCPNPELRFDADNDGDVDQADFAAFQVCYTGSAGAFDCQACQCMNANGNQFIDGDDLSAFEACASGPGIPADPACDDSLPYP